MRWSSCLTCPIGRDISNGRNSRRTDLYAVNCQCDAPDRVGRELPVAADAAAARVALPAAQSLALARDENGRFELNVRPR